MKTRWCFLKLYFCVRPTLITFPDGFDFISEPLYFSYLLFFGSGFIVPSGMCEDLNSPSFWVFVLFLVV